MSPAIFSHPLEPATMIQSDHPDTWIETKTENGKCYYYNAKSRETTWTKPENARIFTQEQFLQHAFTNNNKNVGSNGIPIEHNGKFYLIFYT